MTAMFQTLNRMSRPFKLLCFLLLLVSFRPVSGDIRCYCDSQSCQDVGATECRAEFYCYVSFRAVRHGNRTQRQQQHGRPSVETLSPDSIFDANAPEDGSVWETAKSRPTKQYYEAVNRGCVASSQLGICIGAAHEEVENGPLIRCCKDSWCNTGRTLEIAHAESSGQNKHASVSGLPSVFGGDPLYNALPQTPQRFPFNNAAPEGGQSGQPFRKRDNQLTGPRNPFRPIPSRTNNQMKSIWGLPTTAASTQTSSLSLSDTAKPSVSEEASQSYSIVLQPLHIAIGVCLVILMIVAILLHVLIVLQRRHRRLKRELQQTQKSGLGRDTANQQSPLWLHQQTNGVQQHTSLAILNGARILAHFDVHGVPGESGGGQPTQLGLQQVQYTETSGGPYPPTSQSVFQKQEPMKGSGCTAFCLWCRRKSYNPKTYDAAFYDEIIQRNSAVVPPEHTTSILQNCSPLPETSKSSLESNAYTPFLGPKNSTGFYSSGKNVDDSAILTTSSPGPCTSTDPDNRTKLISQTAPTYAPGSSMSGGSANNQSTAESSLPTQSSSGWTEPRGVFLPCGNNSAASAAIKNPTLCTERPSISGSSETGGFLIGSDFDMRRANVALPPTMPPPPPLPPLVSGPSPAQVVGSIPPDSSSKPLGLASFRCANPQDSCALVAPYAQLQLSLSLDQYDTPEEIFRAEGSDSSCSYAQHASSNPTTNSSLLQSYCEHGGGDYKS